MNDIRTQVEQFAAAKVGKRVWARTYRFSTNKRGRRIGRIAPTPTYKWRGSIYQCARKVEEWSTDQVTILTDKRTDNDFTGENKVARSTCNIGVGECWDLAYAALQKFHGLTRKTSTYTGKGRIWSGKTLTDLSSVKGGEVLEIKKGTFFFQFKYKANDGNITSYEFSSSSMTKVPHTAIIKRKSTDKAKGRVNIYQQNADDRNGNRILVVHEATQPVMNKLYKEKGYYVIQLCGGKAVNDFIIKCTGNNNSTDINNVSKFDKLVKQMRNYVMRNQKLSPKIKIYVPQSLKGP